MTLRRRFGRRHRPKCAGRGFTLLETLIAIAMMATLLAVLPRVLVESHSQIGQSRDWLEARLLAESLLNDSFASHWDVAEGVYSGRDHGRGWTMQIEPADAMPTPDGMLALFHLRLSVEVSASRDLTVETTRLGRTR